jgi:hypothetical protein
MTDQDLSKSPYKLAFELRKKEKKPDATPEPKTEKK